VTSSQKCKNLKKGSKNIYNFEELYLLNGKRFSNCLDFLVAEGIAPGVASLNIRGK